MPEDLHVMPLVSVVIPTYNRAHLIEESIRSVIVQTYENWELIIVDDGSEDNTEGVIQRLKNPKIRYYKMNHCGRLGKVRNFGIKMSVGEYIAFLDSDDLWRKDKLVLQLRLFEKYDIMFAFSNATHFGDSIIIQPPECHGPYIGNLFLRLIVDNQFVFYPSSLTFKKEIFNTIDLIDENYRSAADVDLVYRMALQFKGGFSNERLVSIRKHSGMSFEYKEITYLECLTVIYNFFKQNTLNKKQFNALSAMYYYKLGLFNLRKSDSGKAFCYFLNCNRLDPFNYKGWVRLAQSALKNLFYKTAAAPGTSRK